LRHALALRQRLSLNTLPSLEVNGIG